MTILSLVLAALPCVSDAKLFHGGRILLNDGKGTEAAALLAKDGTVVAVGALAELEKNPAAAGAERVDLRGGTAVPGLQDAHGHLASFGASTEDLDLRGCASFDELVARVSERATKTPEGAWIQGRGWDQNLWPEKEFPTHGKLSAKVPKNPVFLRRVDGHAALVNLAALAAAKLDKALDPLPKITGGKILLDAEKRATGVLVDGAMSLVEKVVPPPDKATLERRLLSAQEKLLALGITCVHDMGTRLPELAVLRELREKGRLRLRVVSYVWANDAFDEKTVIETLMLPDPQEVLDVAGVKLMVDGALGSRGAALLSDYSDAPGERGLLILSENELGAKLAFAARNRLQPAVHAIGDRANRIVLDAYEKLEAAIPGSRELRPRIEHAQVVDKRDWPRFPALGVVASMQPTHATSDAPWAEARLGKERVAEAYAWRALAPDLGRLAFGSDFPVENPDPRLGLFAARTRRDPQDAAAAAFFPEQSVDGGAALAGFTSGAAYACRQEDRRGRLTPGFACDLTVFSVDPVACDPKALLDARVLLVAINGEIVLRAK